MTSTAVPVALLMAAGVAARAQAGAGVLGVGTGDLRVVVGDRATAVERRAAELLVETVKERAGLEVSLEGGTRAPLELWIGTAASGSALRAFCHGRPEAEALGTDGYFLATEPDERGRLFVMGQSPSGVVAGVGKLLRLMRYGEGWLEVPAVAMADSPRLPVRGIYFATHFENFYHVAPLEEVDRVIEDFALWGGNSLSVWFDMHHFEGFEDPAAQAHLSRLKHLGETATRVGMQFGLTFIANEGYGNSPPELRQQNAPGSYGVEVCPSKPEGLALIGRCQAQVLEAFPQVDFIWTWPYDQGGCWCEQCQPWGAKGFLIASEQLARLYHERFPEGKVWLSTWLLDFWPDTGEEYPGLFRYLADQQPEWLGGLIAGTHRDEIPPPLAARPLPERYPLTCFPEISMYAMHPWGGCGANPLPGFCSRLAANVKGRIVGGWPYSEGIYEDLNKVFWCRTYWDPERGTDDILAEYASHYLGPGVSADAVRLFHLLEETHARNNWRVGDLGKAEEAFALAESIDARLPAWARTSWRWRLLYVRAAIDHTLKTEGYVTAEAQAALRPLADEIRGIYHAERSFIAPPAFPTPRNTDNLAFGRPVRASSCYAEGPDSPQMLTDGVWSEDDPEDFWAQDAATDKTPQLTIDLGEVRAISEVRLQFRGLWGKLWFIPSSVDFAVSEDGERFESALTSQDVPKEGEGYSPEFRTYPIGRSGRYLRLTLGPSQHTGEPYPDTVELTEVEVY